jgi:hypothetical protein
MKSEQDPRRQREVPLDPPGTPLEDLGREMAGEQAEGEQVAYRRQDEVDQLGEMTDTDVYQGELEAGVHDDLPTESTEDNLETLTARELRDGETDDAGVAAEEGLTYVPPTDPPVSPSEDRQGTEVAAGFGSSSMDEPYDADHPSTDLAEEDEKAARIREALRADAATSRYADSLAIGTRGRTVAVRGVVDDIDDTDSVIEVVSHVSGVDNVIDELEVRGL